MLPVSLDCSCFITLSVFYNIYLSCVLSTLCCQFLWIVHVLLPFRYSITFICPVSCLLCASLDCSCRYSITFICPVSCLPYVASFSGLFMFYCPCLLYVSFSGLFMFYCPVSIYNIYLSCVLSTLCCQFLWIVHDPFGILSFICPVSCLLYVASFSGLFMFYYPFGIL